MDFKFSQWGSHSERVLTFNMNIQHPLFWSIWRWARGLTSNDDLKCQLHKSFKASISNPGQWGLSFEIFFLLALISASSTDLQRIQTPDCLFRDFREVKSWLKTFTACWSGCRVQVWVQLQPLLFIWHLLPTAIPEGNQSFWQPCRDMHLLTSNLILRFFGDAQQSATKYNHLLCFWLTISNEDSS